MLKPSRTGEEQFHRVDLRVPARVVARALAPSSFELAIIAEPGRRGRTRSATCCAAAACRTASRPTPIGEELLADVAGRAGAVIRLRDGTVLVDPSERGDRRRVRRRHRAGATQRLRPGDRRRRPGRALGGRLRVLGGPADPGDRARDDRRPGRVELADPQLPRLRARGHRGRARPARLPAGLGVRGRVRGQPRGGRAPARPRAVRGRAAIAGYVATGRRDPARHRRHLRADRASPGWTRSPVAGVYYGASTVEGLGLATEDVYVVGGGNSAGQAALHLSRSAARVRLLVRGASLADDMSQYLRETIDATPNVEVLIDDRGRRRRRRRAPRVARAARQRHRRGAAGRRGGALHPDRRPAAYLLAAGRDRPGARAGTCSPAATALEARRALAARAPADALRDQRARACSPSATPATGRSSGSPRRSARASVAIPDVHAWLAATAARSAAR